MRLGVHLDDVPFDGVAALDEVERRIGPVQIVHWFQAWGGGHGPFRPRWLDAVAESGRSGLITWEPWALTGEVSQPAFSPVSIAAGRHDGYVRSWAEGFAGRDDGPWFLRPMHEMNGSWYPWAGGAPDGSPSAFRAAWIHLHGLFRDAGVTDVAWVWCPLADDVAGPFEDYYPGDDYVDVLALDGYNWGATRPEYGGWRWPGQIFDVALARLTALGPQPIWLAEVGSAPEGGDKARWVTELLTSVGPDRLEAIVFFNLDKERDWRVDHDPAVARALRRARGR